MPLRKAKAIDFCHSPFHDAFLSKTPCVSRSTLISLPCRTSFFAGHVYLKLCLISIQVEDGSISSVTISFLTSFVWSSTFQHSGLGEVLPALDASC